MTSFTTPLSFSVIVSCTRKGGVQHEGESAWKPFLLYFMPEYRKWVSTLVDSHDEQVGENSIVRSSIPKTVVIIIDQKQWDSIPDHAKPVTIFTVVITTSSVVKYKINRLKNNSKNERAIVAASLDDALMKLSSTVFAAPLGQIFVSGTASLINESMIHPLCDDIHIIQILEEVKCNEYINQVDTKRFDLVHVGAVQFFPSPALNLGYRCVPYQFLAYERKKVSPSAFVSLYPSILPSVSFSIVVAATRSGGIGLDNDLPWGRCLATESTNYKKITSTVRDDRENDSTINLLAVVNAVIMGRKTWESLPSHIQLLQDRYNVIITSSSSLSFNNEKAITATSLSHALFLLSTEPLSFRIDQIFLLGGSSLIDEGMNDPRCRFVYLTEVLKEMQCDVYIKGVDKKMWELVDTSEVVVENNIPFQFLTYTRKNVASGPKAVVVLPSSSPSIFTCPTPVYLSHVEPLKEALQREPFPFPTVISTSSSSSPSSSPSLSSQCTTVANSISQNLPQFPKPLKKVPLQEFQFGIITALPLERTAVVCQLEEKFAPLPTTLGDTNAYAYGKIGYFNVVVVSLPTGQYGEVHAGLVATNMSRTFPNIKYYFLVGIAGAAPSLKNDIRLGDIVVSSDSLLVFDYGKEEKDNYVLKDPLVIPPCQYLRGQLSRFESNFSMNQSDIQKLFKINLDQLNSIKNGEICIFKKPGEKDQLFDNESKEIERKVRENCDELKFFLGKIATSSTVMKNSVVRDKIIKEHGVLCFEMEAHGVYAVENVGYIVIRGMCDYSSQHKNKSWQGYAAARAAAFLKMFIQHFPPPKISDYQG